MNLSIHFTLVDRDQNCRYAEYEVGLEEYLFSSTVVTPGQVFREAQREFGRCISKVYNDRRRIDGTWYTAECGWVFLSRQRYEDTGKPYLREAWVSIYEHTPPQPVELDSLTERIAV